jgi:hypothetical protein
MILQHPIIPIENLPRGALLFICLLSQKNLTPAVSSLKQPIQISQISTPRLLSQQTLNQLNQRMMHHLFMKSREK